MTISFNPTRQSVTPTKRENTRLERKNVSNNPNFGVLKVCNKGHAAIFNLPAHVTKALNNALPELFKLGKKADILLWRKGSQLRYKTFHLNEMKKKLPHLSDDMSNVNIKYGIPIDHTDAPKGDIKQFIVDTLTTKVNYYSKRNKNQKNEEIPTTNNIKDTINKLNIEL